MINVNNINWLYVIAVELIFAIVLFALILKTLNSRR